VQVYFDFMRSFRTEFDDLFVEGRISAVEIGLGASGELKYPSFSERMGWRYPGIGEFQVSSKLAFSFLYCNFMIYILFFFSVYCGFLFLNEIRMHSNLPIALKS
jgi:hypothetical protein